MDKATVPARGSSSGPEGDADAGAPVSLGREVPTGQVALPHLFLLCQVEPSGCLALQGRRNGFFSMWLRLGCNFT